tara:strand:+ start:2937 stop:3380 length:444 start_codon:yes stop_codon:yes gene_type:complete
MTEFDNFLQSDKSYQLILERHRNVHSESTSAGQQIMFEAQKVNGLLTATDLLIEKLGEHECVKDGDTIDKELKRLTGCDSDRWYSVISFTLDLLRDEIVQQCQAVVTAQRDYEKAKENALQHCSSLTAAREEAGKRFKKEQSDKAKK